MQNRTHRKPNPILSLLLAVLLCSQTAFAVPAAASGEDAQRYTGKVLAAINTDRQALQYRRHESLDK